MLNLCTPALVYFVISAASVAIMLIQSMMSPDASSYCVGMYKCNVGSITAIFAMKIIYILVWTWILQLICSRGYETISWVLVLLPVLIMFILIALVMLTGFHTDGMLPTVNAWSLF
jgi:hypothetical protein